MTRLATAPASPAFVLTWLKDGRRRISRLTRKTARGVEVDDVHDLRVACRRLRTAVDLFAGDWPASASERVDRAARALMRTLAPLREADVARLERLPPLGGDDLAAGLVREKTRFSRALARARAREARRRRARIAKRGRAVVDAVAHLLRKLKHEGPHEVSARVLDVRLAARAGEARRRLRGVSSVAETEALHALRIALKRLRYTAELAAQAVAGGAYEAVADACKPLLDRAGASQDLADLGARLAAAQEEAHADGKNGRRVERLSRLRELAAEAREAEAHAFLAAAQSSPVLHTARRGRGSPRRNVT